MSLQPVEGRSGATIHLESGSRRNYPRVAYIFDGWVVDATRGSRLPDLNVPGRLAILFVRPTLDRRRFFGKLSISG